MNEVFSFRKELNIKKIITVGILILLIITIGIISLLNILSKRKEQELEDAKPNKIFFDLDKSISINLPKTYGLVQYVPSNNYLIELRAENNLDIFITYEEKFQNYTLSEIISADIKSYTEQFNNYSNLSEQKSFEVNGNPACTYSLHYLDSKSKTTYYLQIVWLETDTGYYIFDIEFPLDSLNNYSNIINETLNSFIIY